MKKIISIVFMMVILLTLSGCSSKKGSTPEKFETFMKDQNFYVNTITNEVIAENMKVSKIADNKKYQIEYFEFSSVKDGKNAFNSNKSIIEKSKGKNAKEKTKQSGEYNFYSYSTSDQYACIARSGKTLVYVYSTSEYKKEINKIFKKLNY